MREIRTVSTDSRVNRVWAGAPAKARRQRGPSLKTDRDSAGLHCSPFGKRIERGRESYAHSWKTCGDVRGSSVDEFARVGASGDNAARCGCTDANRNDEPAAGPI